MQSKEKASVEEVVVFSVGEVKEVSGMYFFVLDIGAMQLELYQWNKPQLQNDYQDLSVFCLSEQMIINMMTFTLQNKVDQKKEGDQKSSLIWKDPMGIL